MRRLALLVPLIAGLIISLGACIDIPRRERHQPVRHRRPAPAAPATTAEARKCLGSLAAAQAIFTALPDQYFGAGCSTVNTVRLGSLRSDQATLTLTNLGPVACPLANTFAAWARYGADRAARQILGSPLVRIETLGSYNCRNVAGSGRRSAHARAEAIDVSGFVLADGRRVSVLGDWSAGTADERRFLRVVHQSACRRFGTVLGPDYNAAHRNHLHLEYTGSRFCR